VLCGFALAGSVTLAGCTASTAGTGALSPLAAPSGSTASGQPGESTTASPTETPPTTGAPSPTSYHMLRFTLPAGWRIAPEATSACLDPAGAPAGACTVKILDFNAVAAAHVQMTPPDPKADHGWWMGPGAPTCVPGQAAPVVDSALVTTSFVKMANKTAAYSVWRVNCVTAAQNFSTRMWWLPVTKVAFVQNSGGAGPTDAQVDKIIASMTVVD
jgi:hypothetical protein